MDKNDRHTSALTRNMLALLRRIFRRCQGRPVNAVSRQMTPEEAVDLHARLAAHGLTDDDESRDGARGKSRVIQ
jgi:hypothetical protein